jgi:hypothetical protein
MPTCIASHAYHMRFIYKTYNVHATYAYRTTYLVYRISYIVHCIPYTVYRMSYIVYHIMYYVYSLLHNSHLKNVGEISIFTPNHLLASIAPFSQKSVDCIDIVRERV